MMCKEIVQVGDICINYSAPAPGWLSERNILRVPASCQTQNCHLQGRGRSKIRAGMQPDNCLMTVEVIENWWWCNFTCEVLCVARWHSFTDSPLAYLLSLQGVNQDDLVSRCPWWRDVTTFVGKKIWLEARFTTSAMITQVKPAGHQITTFGSTVFLVSYKLDWLWPLLKTPWYNITLHCNV